jgi:hypothetical protein
MRGLVALLLLVLATLTARPASAGVDGEVVPGAFVSSGVPTAVVVRGPSGEELGGFRWRGGGGGRWVCTYHRVDAPMSGPTISPINYLSDPVQPEQGQVYAFLCRNERGVLIHTRLVRYDPGDPLGGLFAAERAAELALEGLVLPVPVLGVNPPGWQLVGVPTWLWVEGEWGSRSASASVGGVTSTVVAVPTGVSWDLGDGGRVRCEGPGTRFDPGRPVVVQRSSCSYTYGWSSWGRPSGVFEVTGTVSYAVRWFASTGVGGDLGVLTRSATMPVRVVEVQAVVR